MRYFVFKAAHREAAFKHLRLVPGNAGTTGYTGLLLRNGWYVIYCHGDNLRFFGGSGLEDLPEPFDVFWCHTEDSNNFAHAMQLRGEEVVWSAFHSFEDEEPFSDVESLPSDARHIATKWMEEQERYDSEGEDVDCLCEIPPRLVEFYTGFDASEPDALVIEKVELVDAR